MEHPVRSLRPRTSVDYADRTAVAQTPGWLRKMEPKVQVDPLVASKENQRPVTAKTQPAAKKVVLAKPRRQSEPAAAADDTGHIHKKVKPRPTAKEAAEQRSKSSQGTQSARSRSSQRQGKTASAVEDTAIQNLPAASQADPIQPAKPQEQIRKQEAAAEPAHARQQASKRKTRGTSANNRSKKAKQVPQKGGDGLPAEVPHEPSSGAELEEERLADSEQELPGSGNESPQQTASLEPGAITELQLLPEAQQQQQTQLQQPLLQQQLSAGPSENFLKLQADYADLLSRYQELQNTHIHSLEEMLSNKNAEEDGHIDAATKLAEHWKGEAEEMEARLQASNATDLEQELQRLQQSLHDAQGQQLETEAQVLKEQELVVQLSLELQAAKAASQSDKQDLLAELATARQQAQHADAADKEVQVDLQPPVADASAQAPSLHQQRPAVALSALSGPGLTPRAAAMPVKPASVHMHEAKAVCPEGNDASEQYQAPVHVPGASWPAGSHSWPVNAHAAGEAVTGPLPSDLNHVRTPGIAQADGNPMLDICSYQSPAAPQSTPMVLSAVHHAQEAQAVATPPTALPTGLPHDLVPYSAPSAGSYHRTLLTRFAAEALMARGSDRRLMGPAEPSPELVHSQQGHTEGAAPAGTAARQLQYPSGSGSAALHSAGGAVLHSPHQSDLSDAQPLGVSMAQEALETLVGLQGKPKGPHSFQYTHQQSGFSFQLGPVPPCSGSSSSDDDEDAVCGQAPAASCDVELEYNPIALGSASEVLPYYLCNYARFDARQKQKVVGRILDALGKWKAFAQSSAARQGG